jgi:hypothetical protein
MGGQRVSVEQIKALALDLQRRRQGSLSIGGSRRTVPGYDALDLYYSATQPLQFLHEEVVEQSNGRLRSLAVNWARVVIGAIEERLEVQGFDTGADDVDEDLWRIWQANNLDEWSILGHSDAMVHGRSFGLVWGDETDPTTPRITVESGSQMTVAYKPGTTKIMAAAKFYRSDEADPNATAAPMTGWLYLPDRIEKYRGGAGVAGYTSWELDGPVLDNPLGVVSVVPLVNRPQLLDLGGESELTDIIPLLDAINKLATDMMVSSEYHAMPRRWATGLNMGRDRRARNELRAKAKEEWDDLSKGRTQLGGKDVTFGQFAEASLENFISAIKLLVSQVAAIAGLPPHYMGINADNPASADAIRSAESSLVKKARRKQRTFGGGWEEVARIAIAIRDGVSYDELSSDLRGMRTVWADPTTPTPGAKADAALKLTSGDRPIIDVDQARLDLGYSPDEIRDMNERVLAASDLAATSDVRARVTFAEQLMADQGLSQPAAFAAVGLLAAASQMSGIGPTQPAGAPVAPA